MPHRVTEVVTRAERDVESATLGWSARLRRQENNKKKRKRNTKPPHGGSTRVSRHGVSIQSGYGVQENSRAVRTKTQGETITFVEQWAK